MKSQELNKLLIKQIGDFFDIDSMEETLLYGGETMPRRRQCFAYLRAAINITAK